MTLFNYCPRDYTQLGSKAKSLVSSIKAGRIDTIKRAIDHIDQIEGSFTSFFNNEVTLIPIPGSSLFLDGAVRSPGIISQCLIEKGLASNIADILRRSSPIRKSSSCYNAETRPSIDEHYNSIKVIRTIENPSSITLVDDVMTLGRTAYGCALRLHDIFPDAQIRVFSLIRTQLEPISTMFSIECGEIIKYNSGNSWVQKNNC
jgi:hypothetical protein